MSGRAAAALATGLLAASAARPLLAQPDCFPPPTANEARTLAFTSLPLVFSAAESPAATAAGGGRVRLGLELTYLPRIDETRATPTFCSPGTGPENARPLDLFPRPRLLVRLPAGFVAEAGWVPPVEVRNVRTNLVGLALGRDLPLGRRARGRVRAHATFGSVRAPVTCPDAELDDETSACFGGERSADRLRPNLVGVELLAGWTPAGWRLSPYAGVGYTWLRPRFRVNFTNRVGETDRSRVEVDLERVAALGGVTWRLRESLLATVELYSAPEDGATGRFTVSTALPSGAGRR